MDTKYVCVWRERDQTLLTISFTNYKRIHQSHVWTSWTATTAGLARVQGNFIVGSKTRSKGHRAKSHNEYSEHARINH